jgi:hypothetical protein
MDFSLKANAFLFSLREETKAGEKLAPMGTDIVAASFSLRWISPFLGRVDFGQVEVACRFSVVGCTNQKNRLTLSYNM